MFTSRKLTRLHPLKETTPKYFCFFTSPRLGYQVFHFLITILLYIIIILGSVESQTPNALTFFFGYLKSVYGRNPFLGLSTELPSFYYWVWGQICYQKFLLKLRILKRILQSRPGLVSCHHHIEMMDENGQLFIVLMRGSPVNRVLSIWMERWRQRLPRHTQ